MPARHSSASAAAWRATPQSVAAAARRRWASWASTELVAVVGDDELEAELTCRGGGQRRAPPQLAHLAAEGREIGLRPLARARRRRSGCAASRVRALLPLPAILRAQFLDGVFVVVNEPREAAGERLVFDIRAGSP